MHSLARLLALRYIASSTREKTFSSMIIICFVGVFIASFALALIACIMNGFEQATHEKLQSIHPHIMIRSHSGQLNFEKIKTVIEKEFTAVAHMSPLSEQQVMLRTHASSQPSVLMLKAIDAHIQGCAQPLAKKIISSPDIPLETQLKKNSIIIGKKFAAQEQIAIGTEIQLFYRTCTSANTPDLELVHSRALVSGFFDTGIDEFDMGIAICSLDFFNTLFEQDGVDQINIMVKDQIDQEMLVETLHKRLQVPVFSWKSLYPALVAALQLEKWVMICILALISLVASLNMFSLLCMYIIHKQPDIALLKLMGTRASTITLIFLYIGFYICFFGCVLGLVSAFGVALLLKRYPFITLPDSYYVSHLPISLDLKTFVVVFTLSMLISLGATWWAARKSNNIQIVPILKGEA